MTLSASGKARSRVKHGTEHFHASALLNLSATLTAGKVCRKADGKDRPAHCGGHHVQPQHEPLSAKGLQPPGKASLLCPLPDPKQSRHLSCSLKDP